MPKLINKRADDGKYNLTYGDHNAVMTKHSNTEWTAEGSGFEVSADSMKACKMAWKDKVDTEPSKTDKEPDTETSKDVPIDLGNTISTADDVVLDIWASMMRNPYHYRTDGYKSMPPDQWFRQPFDGVAYYIKRKHPEEYVAGVSLLQKKIK